MTAVAPCNTSSPDDWPVAWKVIGTPRRAMQPPEPMPVGSISEVRERPLGHPDSDLSGGPLDFLFTNCVRSPCKNVWEDAEAVPTDSNTQYVTRTFHWRPEDFPLEVATYMQCEEPWQSASPPHLAGFRTRPRALVFTGGRLIQPHRIQQRSADEEPADMLDEESSLHEELGGLKDMSTKEDAVSAVAGGFGGSHACSRATSSCGGPQSEEATAPDTKKAASTESAEASWNPDWSILEPPALVMPWPVVDRGGGQTPASPTEAIGPADMMVDGSTLPTHGSSLGESSNDEVRTLRERVEALQKENELLRAAGEAPAASVTLPVS